MRYKNNSVCKALHRYAQVRLDIRKIAKGTNPELFQLIAPKRYNVADAAAYLAG